MNDFKNILFIDIETVPIEPSFHNLTESMQAHWQKKAMFIKSSAASNPLAEELFEEKAGIFSEFAKIVCICLGRIIFNKEECSLLLKPIANSDEKQLLNIFLEQLGSFEKRFSTPVFCGHNIKEFDLPFICRRLLINNLELPSCLQLQNKKPWEHNHKDTMELWKFGDYKHYTSLALLAEILGIPSPKQNMDGSQVATVFWKESNLEKIKNYCSEDVLTTAKVFLKLNGVDAEIVNRLQLHVSPESQ